MLQRAVLQRCVTVKVVEACKPWRWRIPEDTQTPAPKAVAMALVAHVQVCSRRMLLAGSTGLLLAASGGGPAGADQVENVVRQAAEAWGEGLDPRNVGRMADLQRARKLWDAVVAMEPEREEWLEARGQLLVDAKLFKEAMADFSEVLRRNPHNFHAFSSRALAHEGLAEWEEAVADYTQALELGMEVTGFLDPYVRNSRGNALASLGRYTEALRDYAGSAQGFQEGKELDGAIYAAANAALTRIQLGEEARGLRELSNVARRAPGSIDMRAALAALYWAQGKQQLAEDEWQFACEQINAGQYFDGCALYKDSDWLRRIRRWPPIMVQRMDDFLHLRPST